MRALLVLSLCLPSFGSCSSEISRPNNSATAPSNLHKIWVVAPLAPMLAPVFLPRYSAPAVSPISKKISHAIPPTSFPPLQENCKGIACSDPLTRTPIGSPCGCVLPIKVVINIGVAPILLFPQMTELEIEVAAGTHLKQSQVRIMAADASIHGQDMTTVTIYLVPLGEKFDRMTALLIYDCFWQKKVPISASIFGYYETKSVHYPGLLLSPPSSIVSPAGSLQLPLTANVPTGKHKSDTRIIVLVVLSTFLLFSLCIGVVLIIILKLKKLGLPLTTSGPVVAPSMTKTSGARSMMPSSAASSTFPSFISSMASYLPSVKTFSLAEVEKATDGFSSRRILGEGGFGCVYRGIMEDQNEVAVKLFRREEKNGDQEFIGEVQILCRLHHRNLVKLVGVCIEEHNRSLVYELICNGSVESHLHGAHRDQGPLNWDARMKIALGAARALAYLHEDSDPCVIHRDFKAGNILLENDFTPKVSDFGLAREACDHSHHISTRVMGTFGYVAPEYAMTGHLLVKSDVYSYGVVLLELLTGRKPVYMTYTHEPENLVTWARPLLTSLHGLEQLIDPTLRGCCNVDDFAKVAAVASMCVHSETSQRPFMGEVVQALKLVCNDADDINEGTYGHRGSLPCQNCDDKADCVIESNWWSDGSPLPDYGNDYSIATMENTSDQIEEIQRPHSTSSLVRHAEPITKYNRSVPLRSKGKKMTALYRLRGTMSEHGIARR